jgi:hypothetical protein
MVLSKTQNIKRAKARTALHFSGVAGVLDVTSSDEDSHGGNGEHSELGEHFIG